MYSGSKGVQLWTSLMGRLLTGIALLSDVQKCMVKATTVVPEMTYVLAQKIYKCIPKLLPHYTMNLGKQRYGKRHRQSKMNADMLMKIISLIWGCMATSPVHFADVKCVNFVGNGRMETGWSILMAKLLCDSHKIIILLPEAILWSNPKAVLDGRSLVSSATHLVMPRWYRTW